MRVFISYKYKNVPDKETLKKELETISSYITELGHTTFILGRDKNNWSSIKFPFWKSIPTILKQLLYTNVVLSYVKCGAKSSGLTFELICTKLLNKRIILVLKKGDFNCEFEKRMADSIIEISDISDLNDKLAHEL